jgi:Flp pilus assembly pilin Flp
VADSQIEFLIKHIVASLRTFVHGNQHHNLIEYALMAGFVVAATLAVMPGLSDSISTTFRNGARIVTSRHTELSLPIPTHEP